MKKQLLIFSIECLVVLVIGLIYAYFKIFPEYKEKMGSSDYLINTANYKNMIEFSIPNKFDFSIIINKDNEIKHILFFDKQSTVLYNKNIENNNYKQGINSIIGLLVKEKLLDKDDTLIITKYTSYNYQTIKSSIISSISKYGIESNILEKDNTLLKKCLDLGFTKDSTDIKEQLWFLELFSKNITGTPATDDDNFISNERAESLSLIVYNKINTYVKKNNIVNLNKDNQELLITTIPADSSGEIYPSSDSWYYVKDGLVYAYIVFDKYS